MLRLSGGLGSQRQAIAGYIALDPITPRSTAVRGGTAGGWNVIDLRRILGLGARNAIEVHGFDGLPVIAFTKPASAGNGTESLVCSWRLTAFYHPHTEHARDVRAMPANALILFGDKDEAADGAARGSGQGRGSSARQLTAPVGQSR